MKNMDITKITDDLVGDRKIVLLMRFGSDLYGTNSPESDLDLKGIYLPTAEEILLQKVPKSINNNQKKAEGQKNTKDDIDFELYSLQYFIELCLKGETVAIDMLHANQENIIESHGLWNYISSLRATFYTKNLSALMSYVKSQADKYGQKGSRISDTERVINFFKGVLDK